ncbi:MAG: serine hydrolase domain-containing protein [Pseudomonadota bacterium]
MLKCVKQQLRTIQREAARCMRGVTALALASAMSGPSVTYGQAATSPHDSGNDGTELSASREDIRGIQERDRSALQSLRKDLIELLVEARAPGAVVVALERGESVLEMAWGYADLATSAPMTMDTPLAAGSLSKNLTSLAALHLVSEGKLSLQDPVVPNLPPGALMNPYSAEHPLLLEHLLEHTAGLDGSSYFEYGDNAIDSAPADYIELMAGQFRVRWPPGYFYSYANPGHTIAAAVLEKACTCSYDELLENTILPALGMTSSTLRASSIDDAQRAQSYGSDGVTPAGFWRMRIRPSGALLTTGHDLLALIAYYSQRGETAPTLVDRKLLKRMEQPQTTALARAGASAGGYGLGNFGFVAADGVLFQGHTGATDGFRTWFGYHVPSRSGFALIVNGGDENVRYPMMRRIGKYLARDMTPVPAPEPAPFQMEPTNSPVFTSELGIDERELWGWWTPFTHNMSLRAWLWEIFGSIRIGVDSGDESPIDSMQVHSVLPWIESDELIHLGSGLFRTETQPLATAGFVRGPDGEAVFTRREAYRKSSTTAVYGRALALVGGVITFPLVVLAWIITTLLNRGTADRASTSSESYNPSSALGRFAMSGACLIGLFVVFVQVGLLGTINESGLLGHPGTASLTLLTLSLLGPLLLGLGVYQQTLRRSQTRFRPGAALRICEIASSVSLGLSWLSLALSGWVPLVTWLK